MSTQHHPSRDLVTAFAAGTLDHGTHAVAATHVAHCPACRARAAAMTHVGGEALAALPPADMTPEAFSRVIARAGRPEPARAATGLTDVPGLPASVRRMPAGTWAWIAPGLQVRRFHLKDGGETRLFLLKSRPGSRFLRHTHTGVEMTCVLAGSFSHDGQRYGAGDFDLGTPNEVHSIEIGDEGPCVSLVAMRGELKLFGLLGRLLQPFIGL